MSKKSSATVWMYLVVVDVVVFFSLQNVAIVAFVDLILIFLFYSNFSVFFSCIQWSLFNRQICSLSWLSFQSNFMTTTEQIQDSVNILKWNHHIKVLKFIVAIKSIRIKFVSLLFDCGVNVFNNYLYLKALKMNNWIQKTYIVDIYGLRKLDYSWKE